MDRDRFQVRLASANPRWKAWADELERSGEKPRTNPDGDVRPFLSICYKQLVRLTRGLPPFCFFCFFFFFFFRSHFRGYHMRILSFPSVKLVLLRSIRIRMCGHPSFFRCVCLLTLLFLSLAYS
jgi:hypothetical protein